MTRLRTVCALALIVGTTACAQPKVPPADDFDAKLWDARKSLIPPYPKEENLLPIYVGPALPFAFFVDRASVSMTQDGILRYTLIERSASATNVSYEAISCRTYERRVYAFGRSDGTWSEARYSQWTRIIRSPANPSATLANDFFCSDERGWVDTIDEALRALTRGNRP